MKFSREQPFKPSSCRVRGPEDDTAVPESLDSLETASQADLSSWLKLPGPSFPRLPVTCRCCLRLFDFWHLRNRLQHAGNTQ